MKSGKQKDIKVSLGQLIKFHREEKNLTQQDLADQLSVDRQYISKIEKGKVNLTLDYLERVIVSLNCSPTDFFKRYK